MADVKVVKRVLLLVVGINGATAGQDWLGNRVDSHLLSQKRVYTLLGEPPSTQTHPPLEGVIFEVAEPILRCPIRDNDEVPSGAQDPRHLVTHLSHVGSA